MGMFGSLLGVALGGQKKPSVPQLKPVDLVKEQGKATEANIANAPAASKLAGLTADQIDQMISRMFPNWSTISGQASKNIEDQLSGKIPAAAQEAIQKKVAGQSLTGGFSGTGAQLNLLGGAFGAETQRRMDAGLSSAESWLSAAERLYAPAQAAYSSMFITPQQLDVADVKERDDAWNRQWLQNQISAMGDPLWTAVGEAAGGIVDAGLSYFTGGISNLGGMGGGGGSKPAPASPSMYLGGSGRSTGQFPGESMGGGLNNWNWSTGGSSIDANQLAAMLGGLG